MNDEEKKIEDNLKARFSHINPSRESFEQVISQVTNEKDNRSIIVEGILPSPYQSIYTIFVKKITLIGLPIVALALVLVYINFGVNPKIEETLLPLAQNEIVEEVQVTPPVPADNNIIVEPQGIAQADATSVDSLIATIISDSDSDIAVAINDTEDESIINAELANYNTITTTNYEI
jgi:hypothetical protein